MRYGIDTISNRFGVMALPESAPLTRYSDCFVCGKSVSQIQNGTADNYINKTDNRPDCSTDRNKRKSIHWWSGLRVFLLMPGVVSQAVVQLPSGMAWDNPLGLNGIFLIHKLCSHFIFVIRSMILTLLYNLINCFCTGRVQLSAVIQWLVAEIGTVPISATNHSITALSCTRPVIDGFIYTAL